MFALKDGHIVDEFSRLLPNAQGRGEEILQLFEAHIRRAEVPGLDLKREAVAPGWFKALLGNRREYLIVTSDRLRDLLVCVNAHDYGRNLHVVWYLLAKTRASLVTRFVRLHTDRMQAMVGMDKLDVFQQQELSAFRAVTRAAIEAALEDFQEARSAAAAAPPGLASLVTR
jgi:hypothetical protein